MSRPRYADAWRDGVPDDEIRKEIQELYDKLGSADGPAVIALDWWDFGTFLVPMPVTVDFGTFASPTALDVDFGGLTDAT